MFKSSRNGPLHLALFLGPLAVAAYYFSFWRERRQNQTTRKSGQPHDSMNPRPEDNPISVIIPALREGAALAATLNHVFRTSNPTSQPTVIVVYAGAGQPSLDTTAAAHPTLHLVQYPGPPSRGAQLNFGVAHAVTIAPETSLLLFLHADTLLPATWDDVIRSTILPSSSPGLHPDPPALGTFTLSLPPPISPALRLMLWGAGLRARWGGMPYGDQGYFLTRRTFDAVGGFPHVPIMEDVELLRRVAPVGRVVVVDEAVETSERRWKQKGVFWNTILNQVLITSWMCGVSHETIYRIYYGGRSTA